MWGGRRKLYIMGIILNVDNINPVSNFLIGNKEFYVYDADEVEREKQAQSLLDSLDAAEKRIANGQYMTPEELKERMAQWKKERSKSTMKFTTT